MENEATPKILFDLQSISTPTIESSFISAPSDGLFKYAFRISVYVGSDTSIKVLLGSRVTSEEKYDAQNPKVVCTAEVLGDFTYPEALGEVKTGADIPYLGNMVAMLHPFVREKIFYCFSSNQYSLLMPPLNVHNLVEEKIKDGALKVADARKKTVEAAPST